MKEELAEEEKKLRKLKFLVDLTQSILIQADISLRESFSFIENTKREVVNLFPDKEKTYDLIYAPRFSRIIYERFNIPYDLPESIN